MNIQWETDTRNGMHRAVLRLAACMIFGASAALPAVHAANGAPPVAASVDVDKLSAVPVLALPAVDAEARLAEDAAETKAAPLRYAVANTMAITPDDAGHWETLADGGRLWRYRVHVPNATDLNFGFTRYHLPRGATLYVYSEDRDMFHGPYTNKDHFDHGQHWTPMVAGDRAVIELYLPASYEPNAKVAAARKADPRARGAVLADRLELELGHVGAGYRDFFGIHGKPNLSRQGACNIDTVCPEGDNWRDEIRSVGQYSFGGSYFCTGTMVMDVPGSFDPWFLTANHCGLNTGNVASLVVLWNFESPTCGQLNGGSFADTTTGGATLVSARPDVDTSLLLLNNAPDPSYNVFYSGWDATGVVPASSVGISHPSNDEKALAFNDDPLTTTNSCIGPTGVGNTHWNISNYEQGMTEPGSSGSGVWSTGGNNPYDPIEKHLIGVLSGGSAACAGSVPNNGFDCYGKISIAWTSGSTANQRLADWLDPDGVGTLVVDGSDPGGVGGVCGDSLLDSGEQCDDGNTGDGDGCSSTCQVEDGFECTLPIPPGMSDGIADGGFEGGTPNAAWTEASVRFGTPLCDLAGCGTGTGTGPASGAWWTWFGGIADAESGSVEQSVVIETTDTELVFSREAIICDSANDFMRLLIDGNVEFSMNGADPTCGVLGYNDETVDLSAYNDGAAHTIRFESSIFATNGDGSNFFLDDVSITREDMGPVPSECTLLPDACFEETFDAPTPGLDGWTVFNNGATALNWGTTNDGFCGSVNGPPGNHAGSGVAACVDSDAAGNGVVNSFLCSPGIDLSGPVDPVLEFGYNYQIFSSSGEDAFEVLVGTAAPGLGTIGSYTSIFNTSTNAGAFGGSGVSAALDISAFSGGTAYVCYRYSGDFDWYAQVDDVLVTAQTCEGSAPDTDGDGITDDLDNCIDDINPLQIDSNGDDIGNVCDADIAGPTGPGNDDCAVNFFDLGRIKEVFLSNDADADLIGLGNSEPDGQVNFFDLGRMKEVFLDPPGPSAAGCDAGT